MKIPKLSGGVVENIKYSKKKFIEIEKKQQEREQNEAYHDRFVGGVRGDEMERAERSIEEQQKKKHTRGNNIPELAVAFELLDKIKDVAAGKENQADLEQALKFESVYYEFKFFKNQIKIDVYETETRLKWRAQTDENDNNVYVDGKLQVEQYESTETLHVIGKRIDYDKLKFEVFTAYMTYVGTETNF